MSSTKTRLAFTLTWLATVLMTVTIGFPDWRHRRDALATALIAGPAIPPPSMPPLPVRAQGPGVYVVVTPQGAAVAIQPTRRVSDTSTGALRVVPPAASTSATEAAPATALESAPRHPEPSSASLAGSLVASAQADAAAGRHAAAAESIRRLSLERPLTLDEARWLAGEYDAAGNRAEALRAYYVVASQTRDAATWERIGDLESDSGRPQRASAAYANITPATRPSTVWVKVARAAAADGKSEVALAAYDAALTSNPAAQDVTLEAARYAASVHQPVRALEFYKRRDAPGAGAANLRLEMAQAALAANRPEDALQWTAPETTAGERNAEVRYAHAQALHMTGRPAAAATVLRELQAENPDDPRFTAWLARTAQAQGRHLEAYERFSDALTVDATGELFMARGDMAAQRGDIGRAREDYVRARGAGADEQIVSERLNRLPLTPQLSLPFEHLRDSNGTRLTAQTARVDLWTRGPFRLAGRWLTGSVEQHTTSFATRSGAVDLDNWWVTPRLSINASAGYVDAGSSTIPIWNGSAQYSWRSGGSLGFQATRQTPWSGDPSREMMRFNRISDLEAVGPRFNSTAFGMQLNLPFGARRGLRTDIATRNYSDGNRSSDLFLQFQQVLANGPAWVALQPHVYVEQWRETVAAYYSPGTHVTTGLTLRAITQRGIWSFDSALTPQMLSSSGNTGFGTSLTGGIRAQVGGGSIGANAMIFDDRRHQYGLRRVVVDVRIPLGK
jgi:tetratricopeptide (TPR) repeat protein